MFIYGNINSFVAKISLGVVFVGISVFVYISLLTNYVVDPGFGNATNSKEVINILGIYGAYLSSFLLVFFNYTAYLIPVFFLLVGIKLILGISIKHTYLKFFLFLIGVFILNLSLEIQKNNGGLIGEFLKNILDVFFEKYLELNYLFFIIFFTLIIISLSLIFISLDVKIKNLTVKILYSLGFLKYFFKVFFFIKILFPRKVIGSSLNKNRLNQKHTERSEPTINKKINSSNKVGFVSANFEKLKTNNALYVLPPITLLNNSNEELKPSKDIERKNIEFSKKLETILKEYGVEGKIVNFKSGPVVTLFEFLPAAGIKTSKVVGLSNDIARAMSSISTRISSQPGKTSIGIEIPNPKRESVFLGDLIKDEKFSLSDHGLTLALGKNISGEKIFTDLEKMPHLLIAGTTGSGKSVGINSMIVSLLFRFTPSECKLILIDPKMLELSIYEDIPHLLTPVVTNPNKAVFALKWVVKEMENRYRLMSTLNVKNIDSFNTKIIRTASAGRKLYKEVQTGIDKDTRKPIIEKKEIPLEKMPLIVVVIDEMADLMMVAGKEVENLVQRLAQMARAAGIHLIAATQRPSVDVITGTIKANFPSRISFRVASRFDSRTILNEMGAEQLLGSGDMLFLENGANLTRLHGGFISESEIESVVNHIKSQSNYEIPKDITIEEATPNNALNLGFENKDVDELYEKALAIVIEQQKVSTSFIQRYLQIGYNRAARIVEKMEEDGYISETSHAGKRSVLKKIK